MKTTPDIPSKAAKHLIRHWQQWWRKQSPTRQDRFANLAPVAAVVLFMAAIASAFWYLRGEEIEREQEAVRRDVEYAQQRLRLRLLERQEQVMRLARDISNQELRKDQFIVRAEALVQQYPEYQSLTWVDERRQIVVAHSASSLLQVQPLRPASTLPLGDTETHYSLARDLMQPIYGLVEPAAEPKEQARPLLQLHTPLTNEKGQFAGVVMAQYTLEGLLRYGTPTEILAKYAISLSNAQGQSLAGQTIPTRPQSWPALPWLSPAGNEYLVPVSPVGNGLLLRAQAWRTSTGLIGNAQFWMVGALSLMTAWMLIAN